MKGKIKINIGKKAIIFAAICVVLVLIDLVTKIFEERYDWHFIIIRNFLEVSGNSRNPGCAFSFLADSPYGQPILITMTFIMLAAVLFIYLVLPERYAVMKFALAMIVAGAIGNLIDRLAYREVRDFIELNMFGNMTSCNFADFWIVLGTVLAIVDMLFLNDSSLLPLTKHARKAQAERKKKEEDGENGNKEV